MSAASVKKLLQWGKFHGAELNGVTAKRVPGRGIGVVATRAVEVR